MSPLVLGVAPTSVDPIIPGDGVHLFTLEDDNGGAVHYHATRPSAGYMLRFLATVMEAKSLKLLEATTLRDLLGEAGYNALAAADLTRDQVTALYTACVQIILGTEPDPTIPAAGPAPSVPPGGSTPTPEPLTPTYS